MPSFSRAAGALLALFLLTGMAQCSRDVEGYDTLSDRLSAGEQAQKAAFDVAATYDPIQQVFLAAVQNPDVPDVVKAKIRTADKEMVNAINAYRAALESGSDQTTAILQTAVEVLSRAQLLVLEIAAATAAS